MAPSQVAGIDDTAVDRFDIGPQFVGEAVPVGPGQFLQVTDFVRRWGVVMGYAGVER